MAQTHGGLQRGYDEYVSTNGIEHQQIRGRSFWESSFNISYRSNHNQHLWNTIFWGDEHPFYQRFFDGRAKGCSFWRIPWSRKTWSQLLTWELRYLRTSGQSFYAAMATKCWTILLGAFWKGDKDRHVPNGRNCSIWVNDDIPEKHDKIEVPSGMILLTITLWSHVTFQGQGGMLKVFPSTRPNQHEGFNRLIMEIRGPSWVRSKEIQRSKHRVADSC